MCRFWEVRVYISEFIFIFVSTYKIITKIQLKINETSSKVWITKKTTSSQRLNVLLNCVWTAYLIHDQQ